MCSTAAAQSLAELHVQPSASCWFLLLCVCFGGLRTSWVHPTTSCSALVRHARAQNHVSDVKADQRGSRRARDKTIGPNVKTAFDQLVT